MTDSEKSDDGEPGSSEMAEPSEDSSANCGVCYLSRIPTRMNVKLIREYFQQFGSIGRIYLQPTDAGKEKRDSKRKKHRPKRFREFSEGWVEFIDRKIARRVAKALNNEGVGGKRKHPWAEEIWNIKYLQGFKWAHLNERMAYEKAVKAKRLRLEVGQAKKEAQFFSENLDFSKRLERGKKEQTPDNNEEDGESSDGEKKKRKLVRRWDFHQKAPDEELRSKHSKASLKRQRINTQKSAAESNNFLVNIFTAG